MKKKQFVINEVSFTYKRRLVDKPAKLYQMKSPGSAAEWFKNLKDNMLEQMIVVFLSASNNVLAFNTHATGEVDQAVIFPRKVARESLLIGSIRVILLHNHPSGSTRPSEHDIDITKAIKDALSPLDIELVDHIIVAADNNGYYSFREHGILG